MREAVLFLCHYVSDDMLVRFQKLVNDLAGHCDVYWALQCDSDVALKELQRRGIPVFGFSLDDLNALGYTPIAETIVPGSLHFVPLYFYKCHPEYDYYWLIEYDVVFTGSWSTLIGAFKNDSSDLLASHIEHYSKENRDWPWWQSLSLTEGDKIPLEKAIKSFTPICRLSRSALEFLNVFLRKDGVKGHFEVLIATILHHNGYTIKDIGGTGAFTPRELRNHFYVQGMGLNNGTMRWRPTYLLEEVNELNTKNKLFHPVKEISQENRELNAKGTMKHAILIMAHKDIDHICKLASYFSLQCDLFIHIDKKSHLNKDDIERLRSYNQVKSVSQKFDVNWGGTSVLDCELDLLQKAFNSGDYDYFHLISGQDYPVRPLQFFLDYFEHINGKSLIQYVRLPHSNWEKGTFRRLQYYYPYDYASGKKDPRRWVRMQVRDQMRKGIKRPIPDEFDYLYGSSQWFSINWNAAKTLIDYTKESPSFYNKVWMTFAPEECYVATVLLNLLDKEAIEQSNHRFILWKYENGNRPANLGVEHFRCLLESDYLFARKMEKPHCTELIPLIDKYLHSKGNVKVRRNGAWDYDGFLRYGYNASFSEYVARLCLDISANSALDMGCGSGYYVAHWRKRGLPFAGYDANPFTVELSKLLLPKGDTPCGIADLTDDLKVPNQFDLVVCKDVLPYIPMKWIKKAISNLALLSSHLIVLSWHVPEELSDIPCHHITEEMIVDEFRKIGFVVERYLTMQLHYAIKNENNECCVLIRNNMQINN